LHLPLELEGAVTAHPAPSPLARPATAGPGSHHGLTPEDRLVVLPAGRSGKWDRPGSGIRNVT